MERLQDYFRNDKGLIECAYCSKEMKKATKDHFVPVHKGGDIQSETFFSLS